MLFLGVKYRLWCVILLFCGVVVIVLLLLLVVVLFCPEVVAVGGYDGVGEVFDGEPVLLVDVEHGG